MSINSVGQYTPTHKVWDHVGNIIPDVEYAEGIRPHGNFKPAAWLPVQFYEKFYENWIVIMPGKVIAFDNNDRVVPAGLRLSGATISYTTNDITAGTIDVTTGAACTATSVTNSPITLSGVTTYLGGTDTLTISHAVGVASHPILQWSGDSSAYDDGTNPVGFKYHNYSMQNLITLLCDYELKLPVVPAITSAENMTRGTFTEASSQQTFSAFSNLPVAKNTQRTPITFADGTLSDSATVFLNQKDTAAEVIASGDWHIDLTTGVVTIYATSQIAAGNVYTVTYSNYASAPTGSNVSVFACVLGNPVAGDFLKYNVDSNLVVATPLPVYGTSLDTDDADLTWNYDDFSVIMGQVLEVETEPLDYLDKVKTAYSTLGSSGAGAFPGYAGQMDQMPGSATGGVSALVHYAGAADKVAKVNLISR